MMEIQMRQLSKILIVIQTVAIQAASVASGRGMVRKAATNVAVLPDVFIPAHDGGDALVRKVASNAARLPNDASKLTQKGMLSASDVMRTFTVDAGGLAEEALKPTQDGKIGGSGMVRKAAIHGGVLPDVFTPAHDGKVSGSVLVRRVAVNAVDLPTDAPKLTQNDMAGASDVMRTVTVDAGALAEEAQQLDVEDDDVLTSEMGKCAVVTVISCMSAAECRNWDRLKDQFNGIDKHLLATQDCSAVYVASGGLSSSDIWKELGIIPAAHSIATDVVDSNQRVNFGSARTPSGRVILVAEWTSELRPGLPSGVTELEELGEVDTECGRNWPGKFRLANEGGRYTDGTTWYIYPMLSLKLLHAFEIVMKIDLDVTMFRPIVFDLRQEMRDQIFGHTAKWCDCNGSFSFEEVGLKFMQERGMPPKELPGCGSLYFSNFVMLNMSFFSQPDVLSLARKFYTDPCGFQWHGWEDQVVWHHLMAIFLGANFEHYTKDFSELRCTHEKVCFQGTTHCEKSAIFVHGMLPPDSIRSGDAHPWDAYVNRKGKISFTDAMRVANSSGPRCAKLNVTC